MMKVLIVSDTHGRDARLQSVIRREAPFALLIHLGDTEGSEVYFREWVKNDACRICVMRGNNDFFSSTDKECEIMIDGRRAFLTHGHLYGVSLGTEALADEARSRGAAIAMYGHTHRPHLEQCGDGLIVLNPGSLSYPRQNGRRPSYMIMETGADGEADFRLCYADDEENLFE